MFTKLVNNMKFFFLFVKCLFITVERTPSGDYKFKLENNFEVFVCADNYYHSVTSKCVIIATGHFLKLKTNKRTIKVF